jgi:hypothetical protein
MQICLNLKLVGGFNHPETYESQWEGLSHILLWKITNVWNHKAVHVGHFLLTLVHVGDIQSTPFNAKQLFNMSSLMRLPSPWQPLFFVGGSCSWKLRISACIAKLVGGCPTPLNNMKVSWDDDIPNIWKKIIQMFQTTNQIFVRQFEGDSPLPSPWWISHIPLQNGNWWQFPNGDGSKPISINFNGMNIHKSQLFRGSLGTRVMIHS